MTRKKKNPGDCFYNAARWVTLPDYYQDGDVLVHGTPLFRGPPTLNVETGVVLNTGEPYGHAWVEREHIVFDVTRDIDKPMVMTKQQYYLLGRIDPATCIRYTQQETIEQLLKAKTYGPWELRVPVNG